MIIMYHGIFFVKNQKSHLKSILKIHLVIYLKILGGLFITRFNITKSGIKN